MYERKNEMGRILALYKWNLSHNSQFLLNSYWSLFQLFSLSWSKPFFLKYWYSLRHRRDSGLNRGATVMWLWVKVSIFYPSITWCCIRLGWLIWNVRWQNVSAIPVLFPLPKNRMGFYPVPSKIAGVADGYHLFRMGYTSLMATQISQLWMKMKRTQWNVNRRELPKKDRASKLM